VDHALDGLIGILDNQGDKEEYQVPSHNIEVSIVDHNADIAIVTARKHRKRLDDIPKVSGC
jgi:hypothetical protein